MRALPWSEKDQQRISAWVTTWVAGAAPLTDAERVALRPLLRPSPAVARERHEDAA